MKTLKVGDKRFKKGSTVYTYEHGKHRQWKVIKIDPIRMVGLSDMSLQFVKQVKAQAIYLIDNNGVKCSFDLSFHKILIN